MKIAFFSSHNLWPSHYETELEIIELHIAKGDEVVQLSCIAELPACDQNLSHSMDICLRCCQKLRLGKEMLSRKVRTVGIDSYINRQDRNRIIGLSTEFSSIEDLKKYQIGNYDIGQAVASSLISLLRHSNPALSNHKRLLQNYLAGSAKVYYVFLNFLKEEKPDVVYVFNGRWAHTRAAFRACELMNTECILHERGHDIYHYGLFRNHFPHAITKFTERANALWSHAGKEKSEVAAMFFEFRRNGSNEDWYSFTEKQKTDLLPQNWNNKAHNIVIFNSSEDEVAAIDDEWKNHLYKDQLTAIHAICSSLEGDEGIKVFLRIHPNLAKAHPNEYLPYREMQYKNLTVIPPESEISTYGLIDNADKVVTFGSTVGIEAVYWGKPSILAGRAFYQYLQGTYNPQSHEELLELLRRPLEPLPKEPALIYGYYFRSFGKKFHYTKAKSFSETSFKGVDIQKASAKGPIFKILNRLHKANVAMSWIQKRVNLIKLFSDR